MSTPYQEQGQSTGYYAATPTPSAPSPHPQQSTPEFTQPGPSSSQQSRPSAAQTAEETRKDKTLAEFLLMLDDYEPLIPNEVTEYYLQRVGFECDDVRLKRLLSLAAQKFVSDIAADAYQHARIRSNAAGGRARANQSSGPASARDKTKTTLTMDDLGSALAEYGINSRKPDFYM
ncbi:transcription initiation factor IID TAF10 subunit [Trametes versicolor FP-101664 SS1]|uniref:transcription initiation factor IID TAF10 subunit n=1 Tax=Trametes versicolor (strain FP-101664) TaxID=717944 RepID=UPI0004623DC8|nr:transcription initiation factor IID TAF10 subunit [Trametes versicolor FP-101664 SS1]EIW58627.1 transcription initiation factor IID TAF10 subunit [Trametes versicolor FP-101664 SS1]